MFHPGSGFGPVRAYPHGFSFFPSGAAVYVSALSAVGKQAAPPSPSGRPACSVFWLYGQDPFHGLWRPDEFYLPVSFHICMNLPYSRIFVNTVCNVSHRFPSFLQKRTRRRRPAAPGLDRLNSVPRSGVSGISPAHGYHHVRPAMVRNWATVGVWEFRPPSQVSTCPFI